MSFMGGFTAAPNDGTTGRPTEYPRQIAERSRGVRVVETDGDEFDDDPASHPQGKDIIDRGDP